MAEGRPARYRPASVKTKSPKQRVKNKTPVGGIILVLAATSVMGAENMSNDQGLRYDRGDFYRAGELSVDGFGSASLGQYTMEHLSKERVRHNIRLGAGAGVNYFITRNIGIGADAYAENTTGTFIDSATASLILRLPLGRSGFAPYAFGGGGRHFDTVKTWFGQAGAGMEYRFTPHLGVFIDARGAVPKETKCYGVARLGMRFTF
jgi:hypothetical protein